MCTVISCPMLLLSSRRCAFGLSFVIIIVSIIIVIYFIQSHQYWFISLREALKGSRPVQSNSDNLSEMHQKPQSKRLSPTIIIVTITIHHCALFILAIIFNITIKLPPASPWCYKWWSSDSWWSGYLSRLGLFDHVRVWKCSHWHIQGSAILIITITSSYAAFDWIVGRVNLGGWHFALRLWAQLGWF